MKLHLTQKIGLAGIGFVSLIAFVFYLGEYFSPFIFALAIPFSVLILIGYSIKSSKK
jgi:CHASE2 domain-containing sensor protein